MARRLAGLYVETNGCYYGLANLDPWDIRRDARLYAGPYPVIAHPPCERWGRFSESKLSGRPTRTGDDDGCFAAALASVEKWGGVLEHPAYSKAWSAFGLDRPPIAGGWLSTQRGWTCHVEQGHYGHPARKATWLYAVTYERPFDLIWGPSPQRLPAKRLAERGYESARRAGAVANMSTNQRQRTPLPFREVLLKIAEMG